MWRPAVLGKAQQVGHQTECTIRACRQLAPQPEAHVQPPALADLRFDQRAALGALVVRKRLGELNQILILRIAARLGLLVDGERM